MNGHNKLNEVIDEPEKHSPAAELEKESVCKMKFNLPESAAVPFSGAIKRDGPPFGPHTRAFASAATSLAVFIGAPHDTDVMTAHDRLWTSDFDYYRHLMVSGEAFLFWRDVLNYFTGELPHLPEPAETWESKYDGPVDAAPLLDCFEIAGIKADIYSNHPAKNVAGGWDGPRGLSELTLRNLTGGFPVLLLKGEPGDRVMLAVGYEDGGETLLAWTFTAGDRHNTNAEFSAAGCGRERGWTENVVAAALIRSPYQPPGDTSPILLRALSRGAELLRADKNPERFRETFLSKGKPHIHPEIWDLAERRCYLADALERAADVLKTDALTAAAEACRTIHDSMWKINAVWSEKKNAAAKEKIAGILSDCMRLDLVIADTITEYLKKY